MSQSAACANQWDSAAQSWYVTSGFVMRNFYPLALILAVVVVMGCSHRRCSQHTGFRRCQLTLDQRPDCSCQKPVAQCGQTTSMTQTAPQTVLTSSVETAKPQPILDSPPQSVPSTQLSSETTATNEVAGSFSTETENEQLSPNAAAESDIQGSTRRPLDVPANDPAPVKPKTERPSTLPSLSKPVVPFESIPKPSAPDLSSISIKLPEQDETTARHCETISIDKLVLKNSKNNDSHITIKSFDSNVVKEAKTIAQPTIANLVTEPAQLVAIDQPESRLAKASTTALDKLSPPVTSLQAPKSQVEHPPAVKNELVVQAESVEQNKPTLPNKPSDELLPIPVNGNILLHAKTAMMITNRHSVSKADDDNANTSQHDVANQRITESTGLDPVYGLPLGNKVEFNSLPTLADHPAFRQLPVPAPKVAEPQNSDVQTHKVSVGSDSNQVHVYIHRGCSSNTSDETCSCRHCSASQSNVHVVYRDSEGRVIIAPPAKTNVAPVQPEAAGKWEGAKPLGGRTPYYLPPRKLLRLKATTPISRPKRKPTVASIQMRDSVIVGGTHLLAQPNATEPMANPENNAQAIGLPRIENDKLRDALKRLQPEKQLR